jgi:hypothetical protein
MRRSNQIALTLLSALLWLPLSVRAQDVEVIATVDESTIGTDERVVYSIEIRGGSLSSVSTPEPPSTQNLTLVQRTPSTQRNMTIVNGNLEQSVGFRWAFRPVQEGEARIDAAEVVVDGESYSTQPIHIKVVPQAQRPSRPQAGGRQQWPFTYPAPQGQESDDERAIEAKDLFVRAVPSTRQAIQNQQVTIEYQLFFRDGIQLRHSRLAGSWDAEGFWREEFDVDTRPIPKSVVENGLLYHMIVLKRVAVFPAHPGQLTVDPLQIETEAYFPFDSSDPFERFFSLRSQFETVELSSDPVHIDVKPLPDRAPAGFSGAVGTFGIEASIDRREVEVGEPVQIQVTISGTGNLATLQPPSIQPPGVFERYDPDVVNTIDRGGQVVRGSKTVSYILVPRSNGDFTLSPIEFAYFDPSRSRYVTASADLGTISVTGTASPLEAGSTVEGLPVDDIAGIMTTASWERADPRPLYTSTWVFVLLMLPPAGVVGYYFIDRRRRRLATDTEYARGRVAHPLAKKHFKKAEALLARNEPRLFYEEIERAVVGFIGNRMNIAELGLTRSALDARLAGVGVSEDVREALKRLLVECDQAQFAPVLPDRRAMESAHERAAQIILAIDEAAVNHAAVAV